MAGETRGTITRRMTIQELAPEVMAASSRLGSMFRKVGESSRKVDGVSDRPSMNIMPGKLKMLNGAWLSPKTAFRISLKKPMRGAQEHGPADGQKDRGRGHGQNDEGADKASKGQVRALHQPGQAYAEKQGGGRGPQGEQDRGAQKRQKIHPGVYLHVVFQGEAGVEDQTLGLEAGHHQKYQRDQNQIAQDRTHEQKRSPAPDAGCMPGVETSLAGSLGPLPHGTGCMCQAGISVHACSPWRTRALASSGLSQMIPRVK